MTIKVRPYKNKKNEWFVDIRFRWPNGNVFRKRQRAPTTSRSGAQRWGEAMERELIGRGIEIEPKEEVDEQKEPPPKLRDFLERFITEHCQAERQKPSTIASHRQVCRANVFPLLGDKRLDTITNSDIAKLKAMMHERNAKTANNALSTLSMMLKKAVEWRVIETMPCNIKLLRISHDERPFYLTEDYEQLYKVAQKVDERLALIVLLGGDAGLRLGEIIALEWDRVNFHRSVLVVAKSEWRGHVSLPKSGRSREIPMTKRLKADLLAHRHLRGPRVLYLDNGATYKRDSIRKGLMRVERRAGLPVTGRIHILRHTFCSHLAMRGAPAKAIQELAGHSDLSTTVRYMHLSPSAKNSAISLLDDAHQELEAKTGS